MQWHTIEENFLVVMRKYVMHGASVTFTYNDAVLLLLRKNIKHIRKQKEENVV